MTAFYLKILSGNHLGAEIPLEPGRFSLGRGEHCDLILTDACLAESELVIAIAEDGSLEINTESHHSLYLNGYPAEDGHLAPDYFDVFTCGTIHFALGPADQEWPEITLPPLHSPNIPPLSAADENDAATDDTPPPRPEHQPEQQAPTPQPQPLEIDKKWLIGLALALFGLITALALLLFPASEEQPVTVAPLEQARQIKEQLQLPDIKIRQLPDKTLLITGYTQTRNKKDALVDQLRGHNLAFRSQVVVTSDMHTNAETLLKNRGYSQLSVEQDNTPGALVLIGYVPSAEQLDKVIRMLKEEIYGLNVVVDQVDNQASRVNALKAMIKEKGLATRVHLIERPGSVLIQGLLLDEGQFYKLKGLVDQFKTRFGSQPEVVISTRYARNNQPATPQPLRPEPLRPEERNGSRRPAPDITVRGVSMGPIPYVIMADGGKYLVGASLDNGYVIEDITLDYLLLSNGEQKIKFQLGGKNDSNTTTGQ